MSFRCSKCSIAYPNPDHPEEVRATRVVAAARPRRYGPAIAPTFGWEIAREEDLCTTCLPQHKAAQVDLNQLDANPLYSA